MFPTLAALAGADVPDELAIDGRSLLPLLADPNAAWPDRHLFVHVGRWEHGQADSAKYSRCAIRNERFRFVNNEELFDVRSDPGETKNIIAEHPNVVASMRSAYEAWWTEARSGMINEDSVGPPVNPYKTLYWKQFGGKPTESLK